MGINAFPCKYIDNHTIDRYIYYGWIYRQAYYRQIEIPEKNYITE